MENPVPAKLSALDVATGAELLFGYPVKLSPADPQGPNPGGVLIFPRATLPFVVKTKHCPPVAKTPRRFR